MSGDVPDGVVMHVGQMAHMPVVPLRSYLIYDVEPMINIKDGSKSSVNFESANRIWNKIFSIWQ